ncbi:MAG: hypothetical protein U9O41_09875 [Candidatus Aerophobetes bacterium]|nr:hypothetical protein [Candidatus Aerophobetes bacterium]
MKEYELYDWIGRWLVKEKGCQQDKYSLGYTCEVEVADREKYQFDLGRVDVFGIRYEILKENRVQPVAHFHGHIVEVKLKEDNVNEMLGKVVRDIKRLPPGKFVKTSFGGDSLSFYVAYPTKVVADDIISICKDYGIGILKLRIIDDSRVYVDELPQVQPEPKPWQAITNSAQKDIGYFHNALSNWNCLLQVIPQPTEFYNGLLS